MDKDKEILEKVLKLVDGAVTFYDNYMKITSNKINETKENEDVLKLLMSYNYYLGQIDALETIKNFINMNLNENPEINVSID